MKYNIVSKSFFDSSRLDAEFAIPDLCLIEEKFKKHFDAVLVSELCNEYLGPTINADYLPSSSVIKYISIDSIDNYDGLILPQELVFEDRPSRAKYEVAEGNILVSNVRPNRNAITLIQNRNVKNIASSGFTLLSLKKTTDITSEYLFAFFKTKFGINQLIRRNRGSMYPAVLPRDVLSCIIPKINSDIIKEITNLVKKGHQHRELFFVNVEQAEVLLKNYLLKFGSPPSPLETRKKNIDFTVVNKSKIFEENGPLRFDAEFFREEYFQFDSLLKNTSDTFILGDYYDLTTGSGLGQELEDVKFFKQGCLSNYGIVWSAVETELGSRTKNKSDVKEEDILLACTAHEIFYVGRKVDLVKNLSEDFEINCAVSDLMIIRQKKNKPTLLSNSYVTSFLRSDSGRHQVQRCIRGLRGGHVYARDLSNYIRIPLPEKDFLKSYENMILTAELERNKSKEIFQNAFSILEHELENLLNNV